MNSVAVTLHHEPEGWWADSAAIPGWSAAADSLAKLRALIVDGVRFALDDDVRVQEVFEMPLFPGTVLFDLIKGQASTVKIRPLAAVGTAC